MPFEDLQNLNNKELYKRIVALSGGGDKVARCIMLFAFHRLDIAPVDTWLLKAAGQFINAKNKTAKHIAIDLQKYFGEHAGVAQQYIFYYTQFLKKDIINCD
jgi:N-glycosylase/DNA lyase